MLYQVGFKIVIFIVLPILVILYFIKCSYENSNIVYKDTKIIIMDNKEQKKFENRFFKLKYNLSINEAKKSLAITPSDELFIYEPVFLGKYSKKLAAKLIYKINNKEYELFFKIEKNRTKLFSKSIENSLTGDIIWYRNYSLHSSFPRNKKQEK